MKYEITYKRVFDKNGEFVDIDTINESNRRFEYFSIGSHTPMEPVLGEKRRHYFRAKRGYSINAETELHEYTKKMLKHQFDHSKHFNIVLRQEPKCKFANSCIFYDSEEIDFYGCGQIGYYNYKIYDLKEYYDTATLEGKYGEFVADVLLTSSKNPGIKPVFLEVAVTHFCSEEKRGSGNKIIELAVQNESDVFAKITQNPDEANIFINFYGFKDSFDKDGCNYKCIKAKHSQLPIVSNNKVNPIIYYCIPQNLSDNPIQSYYDVLQIGMHFACTHDVRRRRSENWYVFDKTISDDGKYLIVMCQNIAGYYVNGVKTRPFIVFRIHWSGSFFYHKQHKGFNYRSVFHYYEIAKKIDWDDILEYSETNNTLRFRIR